MNKELQVEIISPEGYLFRNSCYLITVPASRGEIGFMADHEAFLSNLQKGQIVIFDDKNNILKEYSIESGVAEISYNRLLILVD